MSEYPGKANQRRALRFLETVLLILGRLKLSETRAGLQAPLSKIVKTLQRLICG
jgi:hypothetical protein